MLVKNAMHCARAMGEIVWRIHIVCPGGHQVLNNPQVALPGSDSRFPYQVVVVEYAYDLAFRWPSLQALPVLRYRIQRHQG